MSSKYLPLKKVRGTLWIISALLNGLFLFWSLEPGETQVRRWIKVHLTLIVSLPWKLYANNELISGFCGRWGVKGVNLINTQGLLQAKTSTGITSTLARQMAKVTHLISFPCCPCHFSHPFFWLPHSSAVSQSYRSSFSRMSAKSH